MKKWKLRKNKKPDNREKLVKRYRISFGAGLGTCAKERQKDIQHTHHQHQPGHDDQNTFQAEQLQTCVQGAGAGNDIL